MASLSVVERLNNPYYVYPRAPMAGYIEFEKYNENLLKLYLKFQEIKHESESKRIFLHLTIGAPMEEASLSKSNIQWRQLYPSHLEEISDANPDIKIYNIIICPNKHFENEEFIPEFTINANLTQSTTNKRKYISRNGRVITEIFYSMMPTNSDFKTYETFFKKFQEKTEYHEYFDVEKYRRAENDIVFTERFYGLIFDTIKSITDNDGASSCFSFAVFNEETHFHGLKNFVMFPEIVKCFKFKNTLIAEWSFVFSQIHVSVHFLNGKNFFELEGRTKISYVSESELPQYALGELMSIIFTENLLALTKMSKKDDIKSYFVINRITDFVGIDFRVTIDKFLDTVFSDEIAAQNFFNELMEDVFFCDYLKKCDNKISSAINNYKSLTSQYREEREHIMKKLNLESICQNGGMPLIKYLSDIISNDIIIKRFGNTFYSTNQMHYVKLYVDIMSDVIEVKK